MFNTLVTSHTKLSKSVKFVGQLGDLGTDRFLTNSEIWLILAYYNITPNLVHQCAYLCVIYVIQYKSIGLFSDTF